jgi:hypothetical protein
MPRSPFHQAAGVVAILVGLGACPFSPDTARAASPSKLFPAFSARKDSLGPISLVADVVVVEDVTGDVEKVYLDDCRSLGERVLEVFAEGMAKKGYRMEGKSLLSVGQVADPEASYRIYPGWDDRKRNEGEFPIGKPPFYVDSTLCADEESVESWRAVLNGAWEFEKEKGRPGDLIPALAGVREPLGTDHVFVVLVVGTKVPFGKKLGQGMLSSLTQVSGGSESVSVGFGVNFEQFSGTVLKVAMIDGRTGEVLWADRDVDGRNIKEDQVQKAAKDILKHLP